MEEKLPTERVDVGGTRSQVARSTTTDPSEPLIVIGYWAEQKNGNLELTDGTFLWPEGLAHYVRDHNVRLPAAFVEHIARQDDHLSSRSDDRAQWWRRNAHRVDLREVFPPDEDDDPDGRPQRSNTHG